MTINYQQLKTIFERLGLEIPESELCDIASGVKYIDEMKVEVRKLKQASSPEAYNDF